MNTWINKIKLNVKELNNKINYNYFFRHSIIIALCLIIFISKIYYDNNEIIKLFIKLAPFKYINTMIWNIIYIILPLFYLYNIFKIKVKIKKNIFKKIYFNIHHNIMKYIYDLNKNVFIFIFLFTGLLVYYKIKINWIEFYIFTVSYMLIFTLVIIKYNQKNKFLTKITILSIIWCILSIIFNYYDLKYMTLVILLILPILIFNINVKKKSKINNSKSIVKVFALNLFRENKLFFLFPILTVFNYFLVILLSNKMYLFNQKLKVTNFQVQISIQIINFLMGAILLSIKNLKATFLMIYFDKYNKILMQTALIYILLNLSIFSYFLETNDLKEFYIWLLIFNILLFLTFCIKQFLLLEKMYIGIPLISLIFIFEPVIIDKLNINVWLNLNYWYLYAILAIVVVIKTNKIILEIKNNGKNNI